MYPVSFVPGCILHLGVVPGGWSQLGSTFHLPGLLGLGYLSEVFAWFLILSQPALFLCRLLYSTLWSDIRPTQGIQKIVSVLKTSFSSLMGVFYKVRFWADSDR